MTIPDQLPDPVGPRLADLPGPVQQRLVSWVAAALPEVTALPPSLKRIADFAPARRARAGGAAIRAALDDPEVRRRAALAVPGAPDATGEDGDDPVRRAAQAWLHRDEGWQDRLGTAVADLDVRSRGDEVGAERVARMAGRVEAAEGALREARTNHRAELDEARRENARLRRTVGDERRGAREVRAGLEATLAELRAALSAAEATAAAREREVRQLQARVTRIDADSAAGRRAVRTERDDATLRARMLLDTVIDAASGLRRELALPPASGTPGERVEHGLAAVDGVRDPSGALGPDSPALLDQYLAMPRARLVVDGYNVTKSTWGSLPLESQRIRLVNALAPLVARTGAETTVVFDAYQVGARPVVPTPRGVRVVFSPEGVIADDVIRDLVEAEPTGRVVVVVTGDAELAGDVRRDGARVCAARSLIGLLGG